MSDEKFEMELPLFFTDEKSAPKRKKPELSDNAKTVLKARYLNKNLKGDIIESEEELFHRVAKTVSIAEIQCGGKKMMEEYEEKFYDAMINFDFLPNSPTLMNAGRDEGQLSACFVLPVGDSMPEIFEAVKHAALIQKSGGGVGYSFSRLRPTGDRVKSTSGVSSGPISYMKVFNQATETIKQGGRRRGANMGVLRVDHPDILEFINAKKDLTEFSNFNLSVGITDSFMKAVRVGLEYPLINPRSGKECGRLDAREVWKNIIYNAWENGEPGILFLDRINKDNPTPKLGTIESTNPCGEACLLPYEACNLGSINLSRFIANSSIDFVRLKETIRLLVRFLDDVIDVNQYVPLIPEISKQTRGNRKIGLGVMGFADMLIDLGISYNEDRAIKIADSVMEFIQNEAHEASKQLARERGCFPNWEKSVFFPDMPIRNACVTSIAPTGTLSIISNCSPGIEPLFGISFERNVLGGKKLLEVNPRFKKMAEKEGFYSEELMRKISRVGTIQGFDEIPEKVKKLFVTAYDVPPERHVLMQAAFQRHIDMSVSKTINLPNVATIDDVDKVYNFAYDAGCKGITVYRYGSREEQVIVLGDSNVKTSVNGEKEELQRCKDNEIEEQATSGIERPGLLRPSSAGEPDEVIDIPITYAEELPCPECGEGTIIAGACSVCRVCGFSKCG